MICKKCGKEIDNDSLFCEFCGYKNDDILKSDINDSSATIKKNKKFKKILSFILIIIIIAALICALYFLFFNNASNKNSNEPIKQTTTTFDVLSSGTWYINTKEYGMARGEGTYLDYIKFLDERTYEKTWLLVGDKSASEYEIIDNYIILNDFEPEDDLDGEALHNDLICKIDSENLIIYAIDSCYRTHKENTWEYKIDDINGEEQFYYSKTDLIKNIMNNDDFTVPFLKCQTDKFKNELQSGIWTIQSWPNNADDEYLSTAMYFSNDNMCYYWNSSNINYDDPFYFYDEFYNSTTYSVEDNIITFGDGKTLSIIENPKDNTYILADYAGYQYNNSGNYSLSDYDN